MLEVPGVGNMVNEGDISMDGIILLGETAAATAATEVGVRRFLVLSNIFSDLIVFKSFESLSSVSVCDSDKVVEVVATGTVSVMAGAGATAGTGAGAGTGTTGRSVLLDGVGEGAFFGLIGIGMVAVAA
jgi:hypothetical protein